MSSKAIYTPSPSFVLSYLPPGYTEENVKAFFDEYTPKSINFLKLTPDFPLNKAVVTFDEGEVEQEVASNFLGNHIGPDDLAFFYSICPYNFCEGHERGEIPTRQQHDDDGANLSPYTPGNFIKDWNKFKEMPNAPKIAKIASIRFNEITVLSKGYERVINLNLKGNELKEIDPSVKLPNMLICDLSFNRLEHFTNFQTFCPKVTTLKLSNNLLQDIDPSIAEATELEHLDVSHNCIKKLPKLPTCLRELLAHFNEIEEVEDSPNLKLKQITLWDNNLKTVPEYARYLIDNATVAHCHLTVFPTDFLSGVITQLDLSRNELTEIPDDIFRISSLIKVVLFKNKLTSLPPSVSMSSIVWLDISENPIEEIPTLPFGLETFRCNFCGIEDLSDAIPPTNCIQNLHAIGNELYAVPELPEIQTLLVAKNNLMTLPFIQANILVPITLDASHNQIKSIPPFASPFTLLDLSYNELTTLPETIFKFKSAIKVGGNPIEQTVDITNLTKIKTLDVHNTKITITGTLPKDLDELTTTYKDGDKATSPVHLFFKGEKIGYSEMIGLRPSMEDAIIIRENYRPGLHLVGVYDGHSGSSVARCCAAAVPDLLAEEENIDQESIKKVMANIQDILLSANEMAGSTMQLAVITEKHLLIGQLGDSRSVLFKEDGTPRLWTEEMKPDRRDQLARLRNDRIRLGRMRTGGMLAPSASVGDFQVKGLDHVPEFIECDFEPDDRWLVVACDGLWDDVDNVSCGETLLRANNCHEAASILRDQALSRGSEDNISVIVVDLKELF